MPTTRTTRPDARSAMTLLELIASLVVIAAVLGVFVVSSDALVNDSAKGQTVESLRTLDRALELYRREAGVWPSATAMAGKLRRVPAIVVRLSVPGESILAGPRVARINSVEGGAYSEVEWTLAAADGSTITATLDSPALGERTINIPLPN